MDFTELNFSDFEFSKIIDALDLLVNPLFKLIVYLSVLKGNIPAVQSLLTMRPSIVFTGVNSMLSGPGQGPLIGRKKRP